MLTTVLSATLMVALTTICTDSNPRLTDAQCEGFAQAVVFHDDLSVGENSGPLDNATVAAIAWVESRFDPNAIGQAGECGVFQQNPRLMNVPGGVIVPEAPSTLDEGPKCEWLKSPENAMVALVAHHRMLANWPSVRNNTRAGGWLAAYNGGRNQITYASLVRRKAREFQAVVGAMVALSANQQALVCGAYPEERAR